MYFEFFGWLQKTFARRTSHSPNRKKPFQLCVEPLEDRTTPTTTYAIMPNPASVNEGAGTLNLTVTRSGGLPAETLFATTLQDQGYSNSGDYAGFINQNIAFGLNQTQATITVSITNDTAVESNETF